MQNTNSNPINRSTLNESRRRFVLGGAMLAGLGGTLGLNALKPQSSRAGGHTAMGSHDAAMNDAEVLNGALFYEHQAIWAYGTAAGALSDSAVGQAVLAIAQANMTDHQAHRDTLAEVIMSLGGDPVMAMPEYDISAYLDNGDGGLDSDVNIAKLALALETDAAIAYVSEVAKLKTPALVSAGASIAAAEAAHATTIRAAFISLGVEIDYVPAAFINADTRDAWVLKV
jgi:rubrerythrin